MWSINLKVDIHLSAWKPGPQHEVSITGGTVGAAFLKCLTLPWLLHVPVTGSLLSHSVKKQGPFSLPWLSACVVQDWKALELDKSEVPLPWYVAFHLIHSTNFEPLLCSLALLGSYFTHTHTHTKGGNHNNIKVFAMMLNVYVVS